MIIARTHTVGYRLPLVEPLHTARGTITHRDGLLLVLQDTAGRVGIGDAAPLAGFSDEHLQDVGQALRDLCAPSAALGAGASLDTPSQVSRLIARHSLASAAAHAVDQAWLDLMAQQSGRPLWALLCGRDTPPHATVPVHRLVAGPEDARHAVDQGVTTLKVKVGACTAEQDAQRVRDIRRAASSHARIVLDANGAWARADDAIDAIERLAIHDIQAIEQPIAAGAIDELARVRARSRIPVAADECIRTADDLREVLRLRAADAVVIKPMLCGGLQAASHMARLATDAGLPVSVTTCFESAVGRLGALHVATAVTGELWSCGLLTDQLLAEDVAPGAPGAPDGQAIAAPELPGLGIGGLHAVGA